MSEEIRNLIKVQGSGGGKSGGGDTYEADDNLFARQSVAYIDALCEGPIKGLVYGDASIFVNEVRLRDVNLQNGSIDSNTNFKNFQISTRNGEAEQTLDGAWFSTYPSASIIQEIGSTPLKKDEAQYFTVSSSQFNKEEADYIKITIYTPSMQRIIKKGDDKGDILETSVNFDIILRYVNGSGVTKETTLARTGFQGKVTSKYAHTFGFNIETIKDSEGITDWALKVVRKASPTSSTNAAVYNDIYVESIEANISDRLQYPYTAYVAGAIDAEQFSGPPNRGYEIDGKIIDVPSNYTPVDYEGKKVVVNSIPASFAVGQTLENTVNASSILISGDNEEDVFSVELGTTNTPNLLVGTVVEITVSGITGTGNSFVNGTFLAEVIESRKLKYTFTIDADESFDKNNLTTGSTQIQFSTAVIDFIDSANNTLYLRDVDARRKIGAGTAISNGIDAASVSSATQTFIPANYRRNPTTGLITTTEQDWDGTFYQSWANNPAWILWDLMTNKLYGLGNYIEDYQINKWELFQIGRYCDELVPAGIQAADLLSIYTTDDANYIPEGSTGLHEPRFSCNLVLQSQAEAFKVLNDVTSMFRGMLFWLNGEAFVSQDVDKDPIYQFTNGNVVGGAFAYEGSANKTRLNQVLVTWNNPQDLYRQRIEYIEDEEELQKDDSFLKKDEMVAMGCTSRGQARRLGKWRLLTEKLQNDTVNFKTSFNASFIRPGDIVSIVDKNRTGKSWGGRINSGTTSTVKLDREFTIESGYVAGDYSVRCSFVGFKGLLNQDSATIGGVAYTRGQEIPNIASDEDAAKVQDDDNNLVAVQWTPYTFTEEQTLSSVSTTDGKSTLTVASNFSEAPINDQIWLVSRNTASTGKIKQKPKLYKVLALSEDSVGNYDVSALIHIPDKFDAVDKNEGIEQYVTPTVPIADGTVPVPRNVTVVPNYIAGGVGVTGNNSIPVLQVGWEPPRNSNGSPYEYVGAYAVQYSVDGVKWLTAGATTTTGFTIEDAPPRFYYVRVRVNSAINNKKSDWVEWKGEIIFQDNNPGIGETQFTISQTGFADTSYQIGSTTGNIVFAPTTFDFFNGNRVNAIENQPKLDFSSLADGSTAYVYYDSSASVLKAVEYSESSDSFRVLGDNYFTAGAGTITSSVINNIREVTGDGTSFSTDLLVNNIIEYTISGDNYYARVARIESESSFYTEVPIPEVIENQSYSIPTLLVDFLNDRIIAEVKNDGGTFSLRKLTNGVGDSAYEVIGTNEAHVFSASSDGVLLAGELSAYSNSYTVKKGTTAYSFSSAGSAQNTFSLSAIDGTNITSSIDSNGVLTITSFGAVDSETVRLSIEDRGTGDEIAEKTLTFVKTKTGTPGVSGSSGVAGTTTAVVYAYQRAASVLTSNPGNTVVSLSSGKITTSPLANSWSSAIPSGTDPLYIVAATASGVIEGSASTDTILAAEWSDPVILSQDGVSGSAGEAGLNSAPVFIYQRSASADNAPSGPTGDTTYTFASGSVDFTTANGWSGTIDGAGSGAYLWSRQATAAATTATDTITDGEWSTVTILAQDGDDGVSGSAGEPGAAGLQTAKGLVYYQSASSGVPAKPSNTTYTFSTGAFSALDSGWGTTPPNIVGQEGQFWVSEYNVVETTPEGGTGTATFQTSKSSFNFTDVVIFQDLSADTTTVINGGNITTGEITISDTSLGAIKAGKTGYSDDTNSGFFLGFDSNCAKFHIGNEVQNLKWTGSSLEVAGEISSSVVRIKDTLILTGSTVQGELEATTLAPGSVTVDSLSNAVINLIDSRVGTQVGSTFDGYYVRNPVSTTYDGAASQSTVLLVNGAGSPTAVTRGSKSIELLLKASHFWSSESSITAGLTGSGQFQFSTNSTGPWTNAGVAVPFTITRSPLVLFGSILYLYGLTINNTQAVDVGTEDTPYFWQIKLTTAGASSPLSLSPLTFEASVLEGATGVTTTGGSADNAATATQAESASSLTISRTLTIGDTGKQFNGGADVNWTKSEIGITKANIDALGISAANATLLNNLSSDAFLRSDVDDSAAGEITFANNHGVLFASASAGGPASRLYRAGGNATRFSYYENAFIFDSENDTPFDIRTSADETAFKVSFASSSSDKASLDFDGNNIRFPNIATTNEETEVVTWNDTAGLLGRRVLGTNAFNSTSYLPTAGGTVSGNLIVSGDLDVNGTTTTIDSSVVSVSAKTITVARNATTSSQADGAGLFVEGADASILYSNSGTKWILNRNTVVEGVLTVGSGGSGIINLDDSTDDDDHAIRFRNTLSSDNVITAFEISTANDDLNLIATSAAGVGRNINLSACSGTVIVDKGPLWAKAASSADGIALRLGQLSTDSNTALFNIYTDDDTGDSLEINTQRYGQQVEGTRGSAAGGRVLGWRFQDFTYSGDPERTERGTLFTLYTQRNAQTTASGGSTAANARVRLSAVEGSNSYITTPSSNLLIGSSTSIDNTAKLQITGSSGTYARIAMQDVDGTNQKTFFTSSGGNTQITSQNGTAGGSFKVATYDGTDTIDRMQISGSGNMGLASNPNSGVRLVIGDGTTNEEARVYYNDGTFTAIRGYGIEFNRATAYIRPTAAGTQNLIIGGVSLSADNTTNQWNSVEFRTNNVFFRKGPVTVDRQNFTIKTESSNTAGLLIFDNVDGTYNWWNYQASDNKLTWTVTGSGGAEMQLQANGTTHSSAELVIGGGVDVGGTITAYDTYTNVVNARGGSFSSGIDTTTAAGLVLKKGFKISSDDGDYLRDIIQHGTNNNITIGQGETGLIANIELYPGISGIVNFRTRSSEIVSQVLPTGTKTKGTVQNIVGDDGAQHNTKFNWLKSNTGGSGANVWYKVADISIANQQFSAVAMEIVYSTGENNYGNHDFVDKYYSVATFVRNNTATLNDTPDTATLRGRGSNVRAYKTGVGTYELQARGTLANQKFAVAVTIYQSNGGTITPTLNGTTVGATTGGTEFTIQPVQNSSAKDGIREYFGNIYPANMTTTGKVGIGTESPTKSLHLNYNNTSTSRTTGNGFAGGVAGDGLLIENSNTSNNTYANLDFRAGTADARIVYQYTGTQNEGDFHFITDNTNSPATAMTIKNDGKVGIGSTSPDKALVVSGSGANAEIVINDSVGTPVLRFRNSGDTNGLIQTDTVGALILSNSSKTIRFTDTSFRPDLDDTRVIDLGSESARFNRVFLDNAINFGPHGTNPNQILMQYSRSSGVVGTVTLMERHDELGATSFGGDNTTIIGAGEGRAVAALRLPNLTGEQLHLAAESGIFFHTSPDNWDNGTNSESAWNTRNEMSFNNSGLLSVPSVDITGELASASISSGEIIATTALRSDLVTGQTYPSESYLDFDDDALPDSFVNGVSLRSVGAISFTIDSNNNGTAEKFYWLKDAVVPSAATELMELDNDGNLTLIGQLNATTKSFLINHPTKEGMKLRYGSLEGPENGVYVRGRATTNVIELPDYWTGLVDEDTITVQLTANGRFQKLFVDRIENNKVYLKNASWFSNKVDCYYNVYGERKDVEKLKVEY